MAAIPFSTYSYPDGGKKLKSTDSKKKKSEKKLEKISTDYSEALDKISDVDLSAVETNLDLLKALRKTLIATLNTARGAFKAHPKPGNAYAITRITNDIQNITKAIEGAVDYGELSDILFEEVIKPFLDRSLLDLGSHIKDALEKHAGDDEKKHKFLEKVMTEMYRKYGSSLEGKVPDVQVKIRKTILKHVK